MEEFNGNNYVQGKCKMMCPLKEINMRQAKGMIHILETNYSKLNYSFPSKKVKLKADSKKAVKCFQRSAAGKELCNPDNLRPPDILLITVDYLLTETINDDRVRWNQKYDFINDRLRAVRQDLTIQEPQCSTDSVNILESIVRFYTYAAYRLCEAPLSEFDPKLNNTQLTECLKQLLSLYDHFQNNKYRFKNRAEMEALYQIINIGNSEALTRGLSLPDHVRSDDLKTVLIMSLLWHRKYYLNIFKKFKELSPILQIALTLKLTDIRRNVLNIMSAAYSSKNSRYPLTNLTSLLLYNSEIEAELDCKHFNISVKDGFITFIRSSFDASKQAVNRKIDFVNDATSSVSLSQLLLSSSDYEC